MLHLVSVYSISIPVAPFKFSPEAGQVIRKPASNATLCNMSAWIQYEPNSSPNNQWRSGGRGGRLSVLKQFPCDRSQYWRDGPAMSESNSCHVHQHQAAVSDFTFPAEALWASRPIVAALHWTHAYWSGRYYSIPPPPVAFLWSPTGLPVLLWHQQAIFTPQDHHLHIFFLLMGSFSGNS